MNLSARFEELSLLFYAFEDIISPPFILCSFALICCTLKDGDVIISLV